MKLQKLLTPALAIAFAGTAVAQGGDDCSIPTALGAVGSIGFDTTAATTSGFSGGGACGGGSTTINQDRFWVFTVPAAGDYKFDTFGSSYDTKLSIHNGFDCNATCLDYNDDTGGLQSEVTGTALAMGDQILVQIGGFGSSSGTGTLTISVYVDPCTSATDDALEDNDTCLTAVPLAAGNYPGLFTSTTDGDFYRINVASGDILTVTCLDALTNNGDVDLRLYDSACNLIQDFNTDGFDYTNVGATADFIVEVYADPLVADTCSDYDMDVSSAPDPCVAAMDDILEENDDCGQEASIGSGTFNGLFVSKLDWDYYSVDVNAGDTLQVDILFTHSLGDTDIFLYESGFCQDFAAGNVGCTSSLICGFSASDNETISWTNNTGSTQTYTIKVNVYLPTGTGDCNTYDMIVSGADGMGGGGFGTNYCGPGAVNSSGMSGIIGASGSDAVADNNLIITASQVPTGQFAYMIASRTQGFVANPGGSAGNLCVLGDIARFNRAGEVGAIVAGEFSLVMPLGDFPEPPTNGVSVLAGDVWNFQCWHRDIAGGVPTSNFTDAVEVTMQ